MATKTFIVSFERHSKTIYRSLLQNFNVCFISWHILIRNIKLSTILDICGYACSGKANLTISVFIDCVRNQFLKKWIIMIWTCIAWPNYWAGFATVCMICHKWDHAIPFSYKQWLLCANNRTYRKWYQHGLKSFQIMIVGRYLGVALNGLFLLWRHQSVANEVKG